MRAIKRVSGVTEDLMSAVTFRFRRLASLALFPAVILAGCARYGGTEIVWFLPPGPGIFFVATNGNDQWSGSLPVPNEPYADGPFRTPDRAVEAARDFKRRPESPAPRIYLRGGTYFLEEPLILKPEDSGLTLAAYPGETPILSGGSLIDGWKEADVDGKKLWVAEIPKVREGGWNFIELWINGKRAERARHPAEGYLKVAELPDRPPTWKQGQTRFRFQEGDLKAWPGITNAEVVVMNRWVESRLPIVSVDEKERLVTFGKRSVFELAPGDLYYAEGAPEFLTKQGEWALGRADGRLYYWPRAGEKIEGLQAIAPVLAQVVRFEGKPDAGKYIKGVTLDGLQFSHTEWHFPPGFVSGKRKLKTSPDPNLETGGFEQAAVGVPGAVWGEGIRECLFENCCVTAVGSYGLELARACESNRIVRCKFSDLGAGGIKIGETRVPFVAANRTDGNEITGCDIYDGGKVFPSAVGIWIGESPNNRVARNHIHDLYYTGISIGWTWGYKPSLATNNLVEFNHVHHIGVKSDGDGPILSDMGAIYTLGRQPGTTIRNNLWHDVAGLRYGGWGIYFDEGSSGILAESNVVYRTTHGGFHQHYGETNVVRNNIFAFGRDAQLQRTRPEPHLSFTFEHNLVYFDSGVLLTGDWGDDNYRLDDNVYFDARPGATPETLHFAGATPEQWRARGHDLHSLIADPLFVAPGQNDFRLQTNSPALKIGFQPLHD